MLQKSRVKKKRNSSDEQTNQEQRESRREVSLKLFRGIRQLEEPEPESEGEVMRMQQSICEDRVEEMGMSGVRRNKTEKSSQRLFGEREVKQLLSQTVNSCSSIMNHNMKLLSSQITHLNQKLINLHSQINQLPLTLQQIKTNQNHKIFQTNYFYERDIEQLNSRMLELERQISSAKTLGGLSENNIQQRLCSLRIVPEDKTNEKQYGARSLPEYGLTPLEEQFQEQEEKSLLEGIDQELSHSSYKQNPKKQPNIFPFTHSQNQLQILPQSHQQTVKKPNQPKLQTPSKKPLQTTIKKESLPLSYDKLPLSYDKLPLTYDKLPLGYGKLPLGEEPILMSFAKNQEIIIVEQEMLSQRSGDEGETFYDEKPIKRSKPKQPSPQKKAKHHTKKSLQFNTPPLIRQSTLQYSPYQQSQVQEFAIRQSPVIPKRLSISKRKVPSLIEESCLPEDFVLSKEERYLLEEIKHLRGIVGENEQEEREEWDRAEIGTILGETTGRKSILNRGSIDRELKVEKQLRVYKEKLIISRNRQQMLVDLLLKTKEQLANMKNNLSILLPCHYCHFKKYLEQIINE